MSNAVYVLIKFPNGTRKKDLRSGLQSRIAVKLTRLDADERSEAVGVLREAIGEIKGSWINANPIYKIDIGKLILKFDEAHIENRAPLKKFFQVWRADPGVDIAFTRGGAEARTFIGVTEI